MGFGNLGMGEILLVLIAVLLLFGAKRIPEIAGSMGKGIREFKKSINDVDRTLREEPRPDADVRAEHAASERLARGAAEPVKQNDDSAPEPRRLLN